MPGHRREYASLSRTFLESLLGARVGSERSAL